MKNLKALFLLGAGALSIATIACQRSPEEAQDSPQQVLAKPQSPAVNIIPGQYIVHFHSHVIPPALDRLDPASFSTREERTVRVKAISAEVEAEINKWIAKNGISESQILGKFSVLKAGLALKADKATYERLLRDPAVESVDYNRWHYVPDHQVGRIDAAHNRAQTTDCAITNAGGPLNANFGRLIWIVDTGIDQDHPDLNVITTPGFPATFVGGTPEDCRGHGTHVAGIAAAKNNTIGVVGIAAGAPVVSVRVFGCTGGSPTETIIDGLEHVATLCDRGDVVNLSLSGFEGMACASTSAYIPHLQGLAVTGGCRIAMAAGNNAQAASLYHPGCVDHNRVFTVANMDCSQNWWSTSNYGRPPIDFIATGANVYSTWLNGGYAFSTGTSMATPVVSGIMQLLNAPPVSTSAVVHNGVPYPIAKRI